MAKALPADIEKLLQDLNSNIGADRKLAIEELVRLRANDGRVINALRTVASSDSKQFIRDAAQKALDVLGQELPLAEGSPVEIVSPTDDVGTTIETGLTHPQTETQSASTEAENPQYVFISYSRQQFYFAESLALHLQRRGIATWFDVQRLEPGTDWAKGIQQGLEACASIVLIASRASLSSAYVEKEWKTVLAARKPVFVATFEEIEFPPELDAASIPIIDFRGNFGNALDKLIGCICSGVVQRDPVPRPGALPIFRRAPRDVALLALELLLSPLFILGFLVTTVMLNSPSLSTLRGVDLKNNLVVITMLGTILGTLSCWGLYTWWTFMRRRFSYQDVQQASLGGPWLTLGIALFFSPVAFSFWSLPRLLWIISLVLAVGLILLGLYNFIWVARRSSDVLRWLPTGEAPQEFRRKHVTSLLEPGRLAIAASSPLKRYRLHYEPADSEIAGKVLSVLAKPPRFEPEPSFIAKVWQSIRSWFGRNPSSSADSSRESGRMPSRPERTQARADEELQVVILSNKTPKTLVESALAKSGKVIAVIASGIQIPSDISEFTRYQWVDYRNQLDEQLSALSLYLRGFDLGPTGYSLSVVPEGLQKTVVPSRVALPIKYIQFLAGYNIGVGAVELLVSLIYPPGSGVLTPLALSALVAAGLMQFVAVGMVLARWATKEILAAIIIASLASMAASGRFDLFGILQSGIFLFISWRMCTDWLPAASTEKPSGPTLALPAYKTWARHLLLVAAIVLYFFVPFGLTALISP